MAVAPDYPAGVAARPYNCGVTCFASAWSRRSVWARLAAFLSFLAVLSALVAPVSMLAEEVRTGKLGGICNANMASQGSPDSDLADAGNAATHGPHCALCGSPGMALPQFAVVSIPCAPDTQITDAGAPAPGTESTPGLPFSRGPPAL